MAHNGSAGNVETPVESGAGSGPRSESEQGGQTDDFLTRVLETIQETIRQEIREKERREKEEKQRNRVATEEPSRRQPEERPRARFNRD